ncbi:Rpn family recombination-promoting nuclease/putative transposase [Nocardia niigatensis]
MADPPNNPHDAYFRHVLAKPANAAGELRAVLPPAVSVLVDWDALERQPCSFVTPELRSRFSDLLFRTRLACHDAFIYVLVEHQSQPHPLMPFRMLEYMVRIWNHYIDDHPKADTLPVVIPVVVHASPNGRRWNKPTELADLISIDPGTRTALGDYLPSLRFLLDDLAAVDVPALLARKLTPEARVMFVLLKRAQGNRHLDKDLTLLLDDFGAMLAASGGKAQLVCALTYILIVGEISESDLGSVIGQLGPQAREVIMTTADRLRAEGRAKGRAEGEARGEAKWRAQALIEQLSEKFGTLTAETVATVRSATPERLRVWSARVLTAGSIDAVFED